MKQPLPPLRHAKGHLYHRTPEVGVANGAFALDDSGINSL